MDASTKFAVLAAATALLGVSQLARGDGTFSSALGVLLVVAGVACAGRAWRFRDKRN